MGRKRVFDRVEEQTFLDEAGRWRQRCVLVLSRAPIQGPPYMAAAAITDAIDGVAEAVTGDRRRLHQASPRTPGPNLAPLLGKAEPGATRRGLAS